MTFATQIIDQHIPSLTDEDESTIIGLASDMGPFGLADGPAAADLAIRTCHCGVKIDGFYEYVDHLKEMIEKEANA